MTQTFRNQGKHDGTLVSHLLQDWKVPGSNFNKDQKFIELEMIRDLLDFKIIYFKVVGC